MLTKKQKILTTILVLIGLLLLVSRKFQLFSPVVKDDVFTPIVATQKNNDKTIKSTKNQGVEQSYYSITLNSMEPEVELKQIVGENHVQNVLKLNRINSEFLTQGSILTIPKDNPDFTSLSPFPKELQMAKEIPKLLIISQRVQAFGVYESGLLIKWGPVSSGKEITPTASHLYFTNWKAEEAISTFDDEWIMKWNFNLDNFKGIGMHQYEMPGYPASHSCVRMFEEDAKWLYRWADQWIVSKDGQDVLANGTPVIIFGYYEYEKIAPWKNLPMDKDATKIYLKDLEEATSPYIKTIVEKIKQRRTLLDS